MNYIINEDGIKVPAIGQEGSYSRISQEFNNTLDKLIYKIEINWERGGISRHTDHNELVDILNDANINPLSHSRIINAAYYYFDTKRGVKR